ncbi:MAG: hypothetical protein ACLFUR_05860 [Candidatus Hadarchaeia archaeon]
MIFGGGFGLLAALITSIEVTIGLTNGITGGIIIGSITGLALERGWLGDREERVVVFGLGWGTLIGVCLGLSTAWVYDLSYTGGFSTGSITGLVLGKFLGGLIYLHSKNN